MGFEEGFKMGGDLIDQIGKRRESRERSKSMRTSRKLDKQEVKKEKRRQQYGAGDLKIRREDFPRTTEGSAAFKVAKRNKPLSGLEVSESLSGKKKSKADAIKSKADAMTAKVDAQMAKRTEKLTSDDDIGEQIELGLLQKRATANKTTAETAEIEANTEKLNLVNGSFLDQQETDNRLRAEEARARLNESKARLKGIKESSKKYKDAEQHVRDNAETQAEVTKLISEAGKLLANPNSKALPYDVMSELEDEINNLPQDTLSQQKAFLEYRTQFEKFREDTDTKNKYAQSRQRQTNYAIGMAAMSDAQKTQHKSLIEQGRHREAAEMVAMRGFSKYLIKTEVPVRVLLDPNESKQFLKYDQDPDNKWHTIETTKPDGTVERDYVKDKDGAPIPNMVLNVEDSRDLLEEYVREYNDKYPAGVRGTKRVTVSPKRASTDPLADLGGGQPAADDGLPTQATDTMTITGLGHGQANLFANDGHPNLHQRLLAANSPDDIDDMMKAITDPQADLWALSGDDGGKFRTEGIKAMGEQGTLSPEEQATALKNQQEFEEKKAAVLREALRRQEARRDKYEEEDHAKEGTKAPKPTEPEPTEPEPKESGEMVDPKRGAAYTLKPDGTRLYLSDVDRVANDKYHVSKDLFWNERVGKAGYDPIATAATKDFMGKGEHGKVRDAVEAHLEPFKQIIGLGNQIDLVGLAKKLNRQKAFAGVKPERWPDKIQYPVLEQVKPHGNINSAWKKAGLKVGTWVPASSAWTKPLTREDKKELHRLMLPVTKRIIELEAANRRTGKK